MMERVNEERGKWKGKEDNHTIPGSTNPMTDPFSALLADECVCVCVSQKIQMFFSILLLTQQ